jgi:hypothetical protein
VTSPNWAQQIQGMRAVPALVLRGAETRLLVRALAAQVTATARGHRTVRPVGTVSGRHWAEIGGAFVG